MNEIGMVISLSHVGTKSSMEIIEVSRDPVVFDHSSVKALCDHPRNITNDQIKACAEKGGVIGLCPLSWFLSSEKGPRELAVIDYIDHIDYVVELVGVDHAGIRLDLMEGHYYTREEILRTRRLLPGASSRKKQEIEDEFLRSGRDRMYSYELDVATS